MQYTPAPWTAIGATIHDADGLQLATVQSMLPPAEAAANMRLIAAAPELLTQLARMVECLAVASDDDAYEDEINAAIAAIAAARGEA